MRPTLQGVYEEPLEQIEQAFIHLEDAFADLDELDTVDEAALQALAEEVRSFFLAVCSAAALVFKKLENPKSDFGALLQNFSFYLEVLTGMDDVGFFEPVGLGYAVDQGPSLSLV